MSSIVQPDPSDKGFLLVPGCDAGLSASIYAGPDGSYRCRCIVCARCDRHTGNANQGHYWSSCRVSKQLERPHFCCPDNCELGGDV